MRRVRGQNAGLRALNHLRKDRWSVVDNSRPIVNTYSTTSAVTRSCSVGLILSIILLLPTSRSYFSPISSSSVLSTTSILISSSR